jgi:MFS family permease
MVFRRAPIEKGMGMSAEAVSSDYQVDIKRDRLVIVASSLGTVFEWYDFFVYGTLAALIGKLFFPAASESAGFLLALATFGVGFGVRPIGALVFGVLGDRLGRKYTFLVTITLMGIATAAIGFLPTYSKIGMAAPILLVCLRALQGLALGGEYGGAAIYVAEHAPQKKRGFYTSFIQGSVVGGFILSLAVVLGTTAIIGQEAWEAWGWRVPFLFSLLLLAVSLWIRMKLSESPVFTAMKEAGETAKNPLRESFDSWAKVRRMLAAMIGIAAGLTVIWYTAQFQAMYFLQNALRVDDTLARLIVGIGAVCSLGWFILFGWWSDRVGRKKPMIIGYVLTILLMFPLFHAMANLANPALSEAMARNPVVVTGSDCSYNPFAQKGQATACGKVLDILSKKGVAYTKIEGAAGADPAVTIGGMMVDAGKPEALEAGLKAAGYNLDKVNPPLGKVLLIILCIIAIGGLSGMTYGPVASFLVELFPARVRYTSMSIPYHIGTGYFGGFLPFISQFIVAKTGDPFAGLWYTIGVVAVALVVMIFFLPETSGKDLD